MRDIFTLTDRSADLLAIAVRSLLGLTNKTKKSDFLCAFQAKFFLLCHGCYGIHSFLVFSLIFFSSLFCSFSYCCWTVYPALITHFAPVFPILVYSLDFEFFG